MNNESLSSIERNGSNQFSWYRIRQGLDRRFRVALGRLRCTRHRLSGAVIGVGCIFEHNVSFLYGWRTRFGNNCTVDAYAQFKCPSSVGHTKHNIAIGDNVFIGRGTIIDSNAAVRIGNDTFVAPNCFITDTSHNFENPNLPIKNQGGKYEPIDIGEDVWIGTHTVIVAGVSIGNGSIVAANSTVTHDVPPGVLVGGSPARFIKYRPGFRR